MSRLIVPAIILIAAIGLFLGYTNTAYQNVGKLKAAVAAYDQALNNSKELLKVRNDLTDKYNNMSNTDRDHIKKLMPDNVDNIRLVIDIQNIAQKYGMNPKDIKYDARAGRSGSGATSVGVTPTDLANSQKDFSSFELEFSVTGTYSNFLAFLKDLERSLRLVDVESISFQSPDSGANSTKYGIRIKTYWLKN